MGRDSGRGFLRQPNELAFTFLLPFPNQLSCFHRFATHHIDHFSSLNGLLSPPYRICAGPKRLDLHSSTVACTTDIRNSRPARWVCLKEYRFLAQTFLLRLTATIYCCTTVLASIHVGEGSPLRPTAPSTRIQSLAIRIESLEKGDIVEQRSRSPKEGYRLVQG